MINFSGATKSVDLPNPTFADSKNANVQMTIRRTLAGSQRTIITSSGEQQFNLTIANLTIQQKNDFEVVLTEISERGENVTYIDLDEVDWIGEIVNWPFDFVETYTRQRSEACIEYLEDEDLEDDPGPTERRYSCTINFRGVLV